MTEPIDRRCFYYIEINQLICESKLIDWILHYGDTDSKQFQVNVPFLYLPENLQFSDVFRGYSYGIMVLK